jgi:ankyrin repeat protein
MTLLLVPSLSANAAEIHDAAKTGDLAKVKVLIRNDPDLVSAKDETGRTALHWACRGVHIEIIEYLIECGADLNVKDAYDITPLHSVVSRDHARAAELLIRHGVLLDEPMYDQRTPLHIAAGKGSGQIVSLLIEAGASLDVRDAYEGTPLHAAAFEGHAAVAGLLADRGATNDPEVLDMTDCDGWTALHAACAKGQTEIARLLIAKGADIDLRTTIGLSSYNMAAESGFEETAAFLSGKGADTGPQRFPELTGPYLGQKPPGKTPALFAKGIVSTRAGAYGTIVFSPDGKEAFWRPNADGLLFMEMDGDKWSAPRPFPFTARETINVPFFSHDGRRLYFMAGSHGEGGMVEKESIWFVEKNGRDWSEPHSFDPVVNSVPMHWQFSMDKKGDVYTSTDNIYCARFENGRYAAPEKLPPPINKEHTVKFREGEIGPFISPDGDYLIFTKFPIGLYISFRKKDGRWTEPVSLSERLGNMGGDSMAKVTPDGRYIFFQSNRSGSTPNRSVYWVDAGCIEDLRPKNLK